MLAGAVSASALAAQEAACSVRSRYDVTVTESTLMFERAAAPGQRVEMRGGRLTVNGSLVNLGRGDGDRIATFETNVRALVPQMKMLAQRGVDLGVVAIREEAAASPRSAKDPQLNARLDARAHNIKARIAASSSSKDWRSLAVKRYVAEAMPDVLPLVGGDLAQQAMDAAMRGDLAGATVLRDKAVKVRPSLEARIQRKLETLQPEADRLCPALRTLDALESGMAATLPDGSRLNLIEIGG
jgi:hypothetical protein